MNISEYVKEVGLRFETGDATEHTFRGDLQRLIEGLLPLGKEKFIQSTDLSELGYFEFLADGLKNVLEN